MAEYKKKKVGRLKRGKVKNEISSFESIPMTPKKKRTYNNDGVENNVKVIKGKKLENRKKLKAFGAAVAVVVLLCVVFSLILPVSIAESVSDALALIGEGKYPFEINGSEVLNCISYGSHYYILTDTTLAAFANSGKEIFSYPHGLNKPVLRYNGSRALVFDQSGTSLYIFNLSGCIETKEMPQEIINADISRNGSFAVATRSEEYASSVFVYNKKGDEIYEWNCAKEMINNVCISPNGKKIAVSIINAASGQLYSNVKVFGYDSANPLFTYDSGSIAVLSLENCSNGFSVVTRDKYCRIGWSKYGTEEIKSELAIDMFKKNKNGCILVENRENDRSDNNVILISNKGVKISDFKFNGIISDIGYAHGHIYCLSDTVLYLFDRHGNLLSKCDCEYGCERISPVAAKAVATVSDTQINRYEFKNGE